MLPHMFLPMENALSSQQLVIVPAKAAHTGTVIFCHGLGQSNLTWKIVVTEALSQYLPNVQWILPQAPRRAVTLNQGQCRPSWFNVSHLPPYPDEFDEVAIAGSVAIIENLILAEVHAGIDPRRIVLVGFSQGAALSMMVALTTLHDLGGVASLSGWIPRRARDQMIHTQPHLPIFWGHGAADAEIPLSFAQEAMSFLNYALRVPRSLLRFKIYDGLAHSINDDELDDLASWLVRILG